MISKNERLNAVVGSVKKVWKNWGKVGHEKYCIYDKVCVILSSRNEKSKRKF